MGVGASGAGAGAASPTRRAIIGVPQLGHGPRHVARLGNAVVFTVSLHFGHTPRTRNGCTLSPLRETRLPYMKLIRVWWWWVVSEMEQRLGALSNAAKRARDVWRDACESRDDAIGEAESAGWTMAAIAHATGLSIAQVGRSCVEANARRQEKLAAQE